MVVLAPAGEGDRELAVAHVARVATPPRDTALAGRLAARRVLRRLERQGGLPRLVHTTDLRLALTTAGAVRRRRIPRVVELAAGDLDTLVLRRRRLARVLADAAALLVPSHYARAVVAQQLGGELAERAMVLPPPVDLERFDPACVTGSRMAGFAERWNLPPEGRIVMLAGPLAPGQGHRRVFEAVARTGLDDVLLVLPGDGAAAGYARELERDLAASGLGGRVRFVDLREDRPAALALADLVVWMPETAPLAAPALAEAQAMGKPVVTLARGALEEVVEPAETGWLLADGSVEELAAVLRRALALDHAQRSRLAERARRHAAQKFGLERRIRRQLALYARVLGYR